MCALGTRLIATRFGNQFLQVESSAPISSVRSSVAWRPRKASTRRRPGVVSRQLRDMQKLRSGGAPARELDDARDALLPRIGADIASRGGAQPLGERGVAEKS